MIVALAGASGLTGGFCLEYLLQDTKISKVISIGRKPLQIIHPKLEQVLLVENKLHTPIKADAFISCLGTTIKKAGSKAVMESIDRILPVHIAQQLFMNGCKTVAIVSAMGANATSAIFYNRLKGQTENDLLEIGFEALHILRPSIIDGNRIENRKGEHFFLKVIKFMHPIMVGGFRHYKAIEASTIAQALVHCIHLPAKGHFAYLSDDIKKMVSN